MNRFLPLLFVFVAAASSGCSQQSGADASSAGGGSAAGAGGGSEAGAVDFQSVSVWNANSAHLELTGGSFFEGYFKYARDAAQLSDQQIADLEALHTVADGDCAEDGLNVYLTVTDKDDQVSQFANDHCNPTRQIVDPQAAQAFFETLGCVLSKDEHSHSLATAPVVAVGDGCQNGLFTDSNAEPKTSWLRVAVTTPNVPVTLELLECGQRTFTLELSDEQEANVLGNGAPTATSCQSLTYSFAHAGNYVVKVTLTGGTGAGDFSFRAN
jgi:hypothetical protein